MGIEKTYNIVALGSFNPSSGSGGGTGETVPLLSITTAPDPTQTPFVKGSKYYDSTERKIVTAVADNTWVGAKESDPLFGTYYQYDDHIYVWDGNSLEYFELEDYQRKLVSGVNIKTINGESVLGSGNLAINTYQSFNSNWPTNTTFAAFMSAVNSDSNAVAGMAYLGELSCSGLPLTGNVEAVVEIQNGPNNAKTIHTTITSGTNSPYRWEYTYWNNGSNVSGWIGFQPELTAGNNITIQNNVISANILPTLTWYTGNTGTSITIADTSNTNFVEVFKNGLLLQLGEDYTISGTTLTLTVALESTDKIAVKLGDANSADLNGIEALLNNINSGNN